MSGKVLYLSRSQCSIVQPYLIKSAMVRIHRRLREKRLRSRMVLQIHDELLLEVHPDELEEAGELVRAEMEGAVKLDVPLLVELGSGRTWWDAHG